MNATASVVFGLSFLFLSTALGSALVFLFTDGMNGTLKSSVFGFAIGVIMAASFWGLLTPAIQEAEAQELSYPFWIPTVVGFVIGCLFLLAVDFVGLLIANRKGAPKEGSVEEEEEDVDRKAKLRIATKLFLAVLVHNIPEGCACGLVFGHALKREGEERTKAVAAAVSLSIGFGIQDFPEGAAVAIPIREISGSTLRGFVYGLLSGLVEPIAGGLVMLISQTWAMIDPWALAFAAGAVLYATLEELVPEALSGGCPRLSMWMFVLGFVSATITEQALGQ
jgi:ZIP family zinc transporter